MWAFPFIFVRFMSKSLSLKNLSVTSSLMDLLAHFILSKVTLTCIEIHTHTHARTCAHTHTHICTRTHTCTHIHAHTHTHYTTLRTRTTLRYTHTRTHTLTTHFKKSPSWDDRFSFESSVWLDRKVYAYVLLVGLVSRLVWWQKERPHPQTKLFFAWLRCLVTGRPESSVEHRWHQLFRFLVKSYVSLSGTFNIFRSVVIAYFQC